MEKFYGSFGNMEDIASAFGTWDKPIVLDVTEDELLLAAYEQEAYEGSAFVLFEKNGVLFEVHGSHCSCYGLEGQWEPEETSWAAIKMRPYCIRGEDVHAAVKSLVEEHTPITAS